MTELALFLIPGFIFTQATAHCRAIRKDLQWPYLFEITIISCIFCLVVRLILGIVAYCLPDDFENTVRSIWSAWVPFKYTVTLLSASLLAWAAGSNKWLQNHVTRPISNPFHNRLYALVAAPQIMLELRNSKVYIAKLLDASFEDHHAEKVVVIAPYSSGRRASPDSKLVIDTSQIRRTTATDAA